MRTSNQKVRRRHERSDQGAAVEAAGLPRIPPGSSVESGGRGPLVEVFLMAPYRLRRGEKLPGHLMQHLMVQVSPRRKKARKLQGSSEEVPERERSNRFQGWGLRCPRGCMAVEGPETPARCYVCDAVMERKGDRSSGSGTAGEVPLE